MRADLRSDTITKPVPAMRRAMAEADVGDDVFREDPTVRKLEERTAELLGTEAALYVASGTMGNQLCLRVHGRSGDSVIAHAFAHIFEYESGAPSAVSGLAPRFIHTPDGVFTAADVREVLRPIDIHHARNRIVAIENSHNRGGGTAWPLKQFQSVCRFSHDQGLVVHLDGARLWNAALATDTSLMDWTREVDSISVCFSKGLGAPVGSALAGTEAFVEEARFYRKMFGGQMRQAGIIAAGALYALDHHLERLAEDHANARLLYDLISQAPGLTCVRPDTNIVIIEVTEPGLLSGQVVEEVAKHGVMLFAIGERRMRAVTHLDVTREECRHAGLAFQAAMKELVARVEGS